MPFPPVPFAANIDDPALDTDDWAEGQVLEGSPVQRSAVLWQSADTKAIRGVWDVTPGVFSWLFEADELFVVLRGQVRIEIDGAEPLTMGPGDFAVFKPGDKTVWHVTEHLRKVFHIHES